jgi:hypothetical protein
MLAQIETDAGNLSTAADARQKAIAYYLAFRRDGGENRGVDGIICLELTGYLLDSPINVVISDALCPDTGQAPQADEGSILEERPGDGWHGL